MLIILGNVITRSSSTELGRFVCCCCRLPYGWNQQNCCFCGGSGCRWRSYLTSKVVISSTWVQRSRRLAQKQYFSNIQGDSTASFKYIDDLIVLQLVFCTSDKLENQLKQNMFGFIQCWLWECWSQQWCLSASSDRSGTGNTSCGSFEKFEYHVAFLNAVSRSRALLRPIDRWKRLRLGQYKQRVHPFGTICVYDLTRF